MPDLLDTEENIMIIKWNNNRLIWDSSKLVTLSIWGYQEKTDSLYPTLKWVADIVRGIPNSGEYALNLNDLPEIQLDRYDYHFGFIGVNQTDEEFTITQWSKPMPLGWFFRKYWRREYGSKWNERFCMDWFERESQEDRFAITLFRCPCTMAQSELDRGRFSPDQQCNVIDKKCDARHHGAQHCVRTSRPSIGGSGQQCCYDDYGELIQSADTMYGGRPSRAFVYGKHPFKMRMMTPTLSFWQFDIMPFFYCCKWAPKEDNSHTCQMFNYWRTSQDCSSYQPPAIASIFGDPHIITFDQTNYTFNGKGEYVLVHTDNPVHKLDIHARFEQIPNMNGTHLTAVAVRDNVSAIVEFRLRPPAARWFHQIFLIADKEYLFYWADNMRSIHARGVTVYEPAGIRNMSHMIAMFDSGAGVEVMVSPAGSLILHVYLPNTFKNNTKGLLGKWSGSSDDDFELPDGTRGPPPLSPTRLIHSEFGQKYRLFETRQQYLPQSLFFHDVVSHSHYDDFRFEPKFEFTQEDRDQFPDVDHVCSDSQSCAYDYMVTGDSGYGEQTKKSEAMANNMHQEVSQQVIRCPALSKPMNGRKTENRYWPGTIVRFACDEGYRLVGYEVRRCREDGLWSWGVDPQCIKVMTYSLILSGVFVGCIIPALVMMGLFVYCWRRGKERRGGFVPRRPAPALPPKTYKLVEDKNGFNENGVKMAPKADLDKSLKSLVSSDKSYDVDNDFTSSDDEEIGGDEDVVVRDDGFGVIKQLHNNTRRYSTGFKTKAEINVNNGSHLTSYRSDTLV
ncbi:unnamed protein product [Oppiella nova]|uniref:Sushi domain-containing protein n=1 Tax=Oppiella nova TaxID=334625 RepID=A0A7R9QWF0_9ACAR|nr:unnamed protein product [Oppiella nova]CAG2176495.1 unnamed protein product [Oppiella nova]